MHNVLLFSKLEINKLLPNTLKKQWMQVSMAQCGRHLQSHVSENSGQNVPITTKKRYVKICIQKMKMLIPRSHD